MTTVRKTQWLHLVGIFVYLAVSSALTLNVSRSLPAFLLFASSLLVIFYVKILSKIKALLYLLVTLVIMPMVGNSNPFYLGIATTVGIYVALSIGLNIVVGFAGLLDLGYVAFYAVGAYSWAIFASPQSGEFIAELKPLHGEWFWLFLIVGLALAAITGIVLGLPALRLRGDYLAIVTLGFGEIIRIVLNNLDTPVNITNGPQGILAIQPPALFGQRLGTPMAYYFIVMLMLGFALFVTKRLEHSRLGRAWVAIRDDEIAAKAMGIALLSTKLMAFALGASFAGAMGVIFAAKQGFIDPTSFTFMESIGVLSMVILGGMGSIPGVIVGAAIVTMLQLQVLKAFSAWLRSVTHLPNALDPSQYEQLVFGLILVAMMILRPQGLLPAKRRIVTTEELTRAANDTTASGKGVSI